MSSDSNVPGSLYDFVAWLEVNKKQIIVVSVVLVVAGFAAYVWSYHQDARDLEANDALVSLNAAAESPRDRKPDPAALLKVAKDYAGTTAAERAKLLAAGAMFESGNYSEAEKLFDQFLKDRPGSPLAPSAAYGVAASLEAEGKVDQAIAAYQNVTVKYPNSSVAAEAKLNLARNYTKTQPAAALKIYDELSAGGPMRAPEILMLRERLLSEHPELRKTNAAPAKVTGTTGSTNLNNLPPRTNGAPAGAAKPAATPAQPAAVSSTNKSRP